MTSQISALLNSDALDEALALAVGDVKARPQDSGARLALIALTVLQGDLGRAEVHAAMAARLAPQDAVGLGVLRQHLRGLHARDAWWREGAVPVFPGGASAADQVAMALNVALRGGDAQDAARALDALESARGARPGRWNDTAAEDLRDLDDRMPHAIEAVSTGGNYLWIDMAKIARITLRPVAGPLDLALRSARVVLRDGAEADLALPAIYPGPDTPALRLGRQTDFSETCGVTIGHGQRGWLVGDEMQGFLSAEEISFDGGADG